MTLPSPQAVEEAKEALNKVLHLFQMDARTNAGLRDSIAVLESLPELRQKAEAWEAIQSAEVTSDDDGGFILWRGDTFNNFESLFHAAHKLTPPTK